jgi:hypothetical protein
MLEIWYPRWFVIHMNPWFNLIQLWLLFISMNGDISYVSWKFKNMNNVAWWYSIMWTIIGKLTLWSIACGSLTLGVEVLGVSQIFGIFLFKKNLSKGAIFRMLKRFWSLNIEKLTCILHLEMWNSSYGQKIGWTPNH